MVYLPPPQTISVKRHQGRGVLSKYKFDNRFNNRLLSVGRLEDQKNYEYLLQPEFCVEEISYGGGLSSPF